VTDVVSLLPWLVGLLCLGGVLTATRSALVHSKLTRLDELSKNAAMGAALARRVASESSQLLLSMRVSQALVRWLTISVGLGTLVPLLRVPGRPELLVFAGAALVAGAAILLVDLIAENIVLRDPEGWAARLAALGAINVWMFTPAGRVLQYVAGWIAASPGTGGQPLVTEAEIMTLVDAGEEGGAIEEDEKAMIYSIFRLGDTLAREVMRPRIDIVAVEERATLGEAADLLIRTGHSRAPVYRESVDNIVGLIYAKDLLAAWRTTGREQGIQSLVREAYYVPEAKKADVLLEEMQAKRVQMAIVVDEYGGVAGLVTIEDIVEEIVGEIRDEYDAAEELPFQRLGAGEYLFSGGINLDDVNQIAEAGLPTDTSETLAGFVYSQLGRVPAAGEQVEAGGLRLVVEQVVGRRIRRIRAVRLPTDSNGQGSHDNPSNTAR
jgi:CBS domain containing-hemolysin-like protein